MTSDPEPPTKPPVERRREPRQAVKNVLVKLSFDEGVEPITCFVWDVSRRGMRLKLPRPVVTLPAVVYVTVDNVRKPARVAWAKADQVGLEFIQGAPNAAGPANEQA